MFVAGRILNRFSKDVGAIDEFLPVAMIDAAQVSVLTIPTVLLSLKFQLPVS